MPKMFGFSRRRMKLGRLKGHLVDSTQATKSPMRPTKRLGQSNDSLKEENVVTASASGRSEDFNCECSPDAPDINECLVANFDNWMMLSTSGAKPTPRFHHAAAVVGNKMVVVGGESGHGMLDDTMILNLDKLIWAAAAPKVYLSGAGLPLKIPSCRGHCLVSWGARVLLVGGKTDASNDRVSVWSFDMETECWSNIEAKGDIPAARSGHTVIRAGPVLILFGGEDAKGRKLNDLHMFDLKSLTWLPLRYKGTGPSPRSNHVAALYGDKTLLVFGGQAKSKILNDLYSLDFETMVWTRLKTKGHHPSPRAGCCGAFYGTKWYIIGGGSKKKRYAETLVFDISKTEWSVCPSNNASTITSKGFSLVTMHHKDKIFLVAFGGNKKEPSNQIEILVMVKNEHATSWRFAPDADPLAHEDYLIRSKEPAFHLNGPVHFIDSIARNGLASTAENHVSGRKSLSDSSAEPNPLSGSSSLRQQFHDEENCNYVLKMQKSMDGIKDKESDDLTIPSNSSSQLKVVEQRGNNHETTVHMDNTEILASKEESILTVDANCSHLHQRQGSNIPASEIDHILPLDAEDRAVTNSSNIRQLYEAKIAALTRKNYLLEGQLTAALAKQQTAEKNLSLISKSKQDMEKRLTDTMKEVELLKEKLTSLELAQEEANNLSNIVHSDNVRLEHDVAFLKAVLDNTEKELHSTRGVLAGERARAFQLQVEVFHLKQRFQSLENRAQTPRKPYHM